MISWTEAYVMLHFDAIEYSYKQYNRNLNGDIPPLRNTSHPEKGVLDPSHQKNKNSQGSQKFKACQPKLRKNSLL